jgi:hypothetical protein
VITHRPKIAPKSELKRAVGLVGLVGDSAVLRQLFSGFADRCGDGRGLVIKPNAASGFSVENGSAKAGAAATHAYYNKKQSINAMIKRVFLEIKTP